MQARYLNLVTDFGFKKLFGEEAGKPLLLDFLNSLLPLKRPIRELSLRNAEQLGEGVDEGKAVYEILRLRSVQVYCQASQDAYFLGDRQKAKQNFFKDRRVFYTAFPILGQTGKGLWNFNKLGSQYS